MGDNLTGAGDGDDEQIKVNLATVPANIEKIAFTVTIHDYETRQQNFGQVSNAYIRILDEATGVELIRYDLCEDFSIETCLVVGELYRHNGEWKFCAVGSGFTGGLASLCLTFTKNQCLCPSATEAFFIFITYIYRPFSFPVLLQAMISVLQVLPAFFQTPSHRLCLPPKFF